MKQTKGWLEDENKIRRFFKWMVVIPIGLLLPFICVFGDIIIAPFTKKRPKHFADRYFRR